MLESVYARGFDSFVVPATAPIIEQAVAKLRNAIMQGDFRPGQKLVEAELCRTFGVSRASLREALRALEAEQLVELVPNRGPLVAKLGHEQVEAIHEVWALLTGQAVVDFTSSAKEKHIAELQKALDTLRDSIARNAPLEQLAATNAFFMEIMRTCGNKVLTDMVISLVSRVNFLRAQALLHQGWGVLYAQEIEDILDAIQERNADAARAATRKHIASACAAAKQLAVAPETEAKSKASRTRKPIARGASKATDAAKSRASAKTTAKTKANAAKPSATKISAGRMKTLKPVNAPTRARRSSKETTSA